MCPCRRCHAWRLVDSVVHEEAVSVVHGALPKLILMNDGDMDKQLVQRFCVMSMLSLDSLLTKKLKTA